MSNRYNIRQGRRIKESGLYKFHKAILCLIALVATCVFFAWMLVGCTAKAPMKAEAHAGGLANVEAKGTATIESSQQRQTSQATSAPVTNGDQSAGRDANVSQQSQTESRSGGTNLALSHPEPTSQATSAPVTNGDQSAGRDVNSKQYVGNFNLSGSAWPLVAIAGIFLCLWIRERHGHACMKEAAVSAGIAVHHLDEDAQQTFLNATKSYMSKGERKHWDRILKQHGLYIQCKDEDSQEMPPNGGSGPKPASQDAPESTISGPAE